MTILGAQPSFYTPGPKGIMQSVVPAYVKPVPDFQRVPENPRSL